MLRVPLIVAGPGVNTPGAATNAPVALLDLAPTLAEMARGYKLAQIKAFINSIQAVGEQLRQNANPQLVLEVLMLSIPRREESISVKYG